MMPTMMPAVARMMPFMLFPRHDSPGLAIGGRTLVYYHTFG